MRMSLVLRGGDLECRLVCGGRWALVLCAARPGLGCGRPGEQVDEVRARVVSVLGAQRCEDGRRRPRVKELTFERRFSMKILTDEERVETVGGGLASVETQA